MMQKILSIQKELGEVYPDEITEYKKLYPSLDTTSMLKLDSQFPWKGIGIGSIVAVLNIAMSNHRLYQLTGVSMNLLDFKNLSGKTGVNAN